MPRPTTRQPREVGTNTKPIEEFWYRNDLPETTKLMVRNWLENLIDTEGHTYDPSSVTYHRIRDRQGRFTGGWEGRVKIVRYGQHYGRPLRRGFLGITTDTLFVYDDLAFTLRNATTNFIRFNSTFGEPISFTVNTSNSSGST